MHIVIAHNSKIPVHFYGGTERVIWYLGQELVQLGHKITYLVEAHSYCDFATVIIRNHSIPIENQIPKDAEFLHFHYAPENTDSLNKPYLITMHGNRNDAVLLDQNTVFVSANHASRFGSNCFVHNGLNWDDYSAPLICQDRKHFHFLGNAAWKVKNVQGAIDVICATQNEKLMVLGGQRFNVNMGIRFTWSNKISFHKKVGGEIKSKLLNLSKGLIFPVRWPEPFGLAIIESLFYGCPVFGTPYGSLPEIVLPEFGKLSADRKVLKEAMMSSNSYSKQRCHDYVRETFNSKKMALSYLEKYETVFAGKSLNSQAPFLQQIQQEKFLPWR